MCFQQSPSGTLQYPAYTHTHTHTHIVLRTSWGTKFRILDAIDIKIQQLESDILIEQMSIMGSHTYLDSLNIITVINRP